MKRASIVHFKNFEGEGLEVFSGAASNTETVLLFFLYLFATVAALLQPLRWIVLHGSLAIRIGLLLHVSS
jgi:hypothetical protein